ncbi:MAG: hypothetical protein GY835_18955 [bacterium]|nr:hypothetical protein [bacterium]
MQPKLRFLTDELIERIISEAREVLCRLGMEIHNPELVSLLLEHGAKVEGERILFDENLIDNALRTAPAEFNLYDTAGEMTHLLGGDRVHFTPASAAISILDHGAQTARKPVTADYVRYAKLMRGLPNIASQSTAFVTADVPELISDSYRLYLNLLHCEKPVVTGAFTSEGFRIMHDLQIAVRGSARAVAAKPLTIFSVCPTAPLKWSRTTSQNLADCAVNSIPVEYISMPLAGFVGPVTLVGSLVQHTAETLSGIVMTQLINPGAPALYGGCPAVFDVRYETTSLGAVETMMLDCAYVEIGKYLGLPTQAYIALSDAKRLDAQAGLESSQGATLAALAGINNISGPGVLDFITCMSFEKLVLDNELAGMALRLTRGIEPRDDFPALDRFRELIAEGHLLISKHTRRHLRSEHLFPGPVIDRANRSRWSEEGSTTLGARAHAEVERLLAAWEPTSLAADVKSELTGLMRAEAERHGLTTLPELERES